MSKHTPGPWRIVKRGNQTGLRSIAVALDNGSNGAPSWMPCKGMGLAQTLTSGDEANARLIAAAPDLLAALQIAANLIADDLTDCTEENAPEHFAFLRRATIAIAKATREA